MEMVENLNEMGYDIKINELSEFTKGVIIKVDENVLIKDEIIFNTLSVNGTEVYGKVPNNLEDLRSLSGVGRKTANVVYSVAFHGDAIAVDTHVFRVSNRIGLVREKDVYKTELKLMEILDKSDWSRAHHYLIYLGRKYCKSQKPDCENCPIKDLCER